MQDDLTFDVHYGYWFNLACERFYKHIDFGANFIQLVGGSSAALGAINGSPTLVIASGLALAVCAAISLLVQPSVKAEQHMRAKCVYLDLKGRLHSLDTDTLATELARAQRDGPAGIGALGKPAFNNTLNATGREGDIRPLGLLERIATTVA